MVTTDNTETSFGFKWKNFPVDPGDASTRPALAYGEERVKRNGWSMDEFSAWIDGKRVLDAGCGVGWFTEFLRKHNQNGTTIGIDIASAAVRKGHELGHGNVLVGDLGQLPFPEDHFDYIACEEVLHHTPDPPMYLKRMVKTLQSGGCLTLYVYKVKPILRETADEVLRDKTTEMPIDECFKFAEQVTQLGQELYDVDETVTVPDIPLLGIDAGTYTIHEFVYRYFLKCYFDWKTEDWDTSVATNFDWYHPTHAYRYEEEELREMLHEADLEVGHLEELMSGFAVRTKRVR